MTKHIARHMSGGGRQASGESSSGSVLFDYDDDDDAISTTGSEETRRIGNCIAHRSDSEMTYYESEDDALLLLPPKQMSPGEMARVTSVVLITVIGSVCYLGSFVAFAMGASSSVAGLTTLGVAGGVTVLTVPFVWVSEWRLTRMHAMRKRVNEFRQLTKTFQEEVEILILEEESLRDELEVLKHDNKRLEQLVKIENGGNVSEVVELVHENQRILRQMRVREEEKISHHISCQFSSHTISHSSHMFLLSMDWCIHNTKKGKHSSSGPTGRGKTSPAERHRSQRGHRQEGGGHTGAAANDQPGRVWNSIRRG